MYDRLDSFDLDHIALTYQGHINIYGESSVRKDPEKTFVVASDKSFFNKKLRRFDHQRITYSTSKEIIKDTTILPVEASSDKEYVNRHEDVGLRVINEKIKIIKCCHFNEKHCSKCDVVNIKQELVV